MNNWGYYHHVNYYKACCVCFLSLLLFFIHVSVSPVLVLFISPSVMGVCCLVVRPHRPATPPPDHRWRRRVSGALSNCIIVKCSCNFHNTCTALRLPAHTTEGPTAAILPPWSCPLWMLVFICAFDPRHRSFLGTTYAICAALPSRHTRVVYAKCITHSKQACGVL